MGRGESAKRSKLCTQFQTFRRSGEMGMSENENGEKVKRQKGACLSSEGRRRGLHLHLQLNGEKIIRAIEKFRGSKCHAAKVQCGHLQWWSKNSSGFVYLCLMK